MWDAKFTTDGFSGKGSLFSTELEKKLQAQQDEVDKAFAILDDYLAENQSDPAPQALPVIKISGD